MGEDLREAVVLNGDTLESFCARHGVDEATVVRLNEATLRDQAQARGFAVTFRGEHRDEHQNVEMFTGYHVFPGEVLRLRE